MLSVDRNLYHQGIPIHDRTHIHPPKRAPSMNGTLELNAFKGPDLCLIARQIDLIRGYGE